MTWTLRKTVVGLRHDKTFKVRDISGKIVDSLLLLQGKGSLPADCFQLLDASSDQTQFKLHNVDDTFSLTFNLEGFFLTCDIPTLASLDASSLEDSFSTIAETILPLSGREKDIARIGAIHEYALLLPGELSDALLRQVFCSAPDGNLLNIGVHATLTLPTADSSGAAERRCIVSIVRAKADDEQGKCVVVTNLSIDFQFFFSPVCAFSRASLADAYDMARSYATRLRDTDFAFLSPNDVSG